MAVVVAKNLRKEYGSLVAVRDVDLSIAEGEILGLIGPNGAGKTTLLKMIATLLVPSSGEITVLGRSANESFLEVRKKLGYMPDFFNLYSGLTLDDCVSFFGRAYGVDEGILPQKVAESLDYVGLLEKRNELIIHLSRGMTQRLGIANLLVHDPALLILDEPASGLDPLARIQLRDVLKRLAKDGKTILISSHILTELEDLCTHLCIMHRGTISYQGPIGGTAKESASCQLRFGFAFPESDPELRLAAAAALLETHSQTISCHIEGARLRVEVKAEPEIAAELNRVLVSAGFPVSLLETEKKGLEALFMELSELSNGEGRSS